ncbi:MAG TPA: molybdopterin-binding protein, partial [Chitinophagaceae bacterium]
MKKIFCSVITIGDELLIGQTIDTNSAWMARQLNAIGVLVKRRLAVADDRQAILSALGAESQEADIILITGGLGPTSDDITKPVLAEYFGGKMEINEAALENVKRFFSARGLPLKEA